MRGEEERREDVLVPKRVAKRSDGDAKSERDVAKTNDLRLTVPSTDVSEPSSEEGGEEEELTSRRPCRRFPRP